MKKIVFIGMFFALAMVLVVGAGCESRKERIKEAVENRELDVKIPSDLLSCPAEFVADPLSEEVSKTCLDVSGEYCSYYTKTKNGITTNHNLQFKSECNLCQTHKQKDTAYRTDADGTVYTHKGYEKAACKGGLYPSGE